MALEERRQELWSLLDRLRGPRRPPVRTLWDAVKERDVDLARRFLERGHDVNAPVPGGTPLGTAAAGHDAAMVRMLLEHGADPAIEAQIEGPLTKAVVGSADATGDRRPVFDALFAAGVHERDVRGALQAAARLGDGGAAAELVGAAEGAGFDRRLLTDARTAAAGVAEELGRVELAAYLSGARDAPPAGDASDALSDLLGGIDLDDPEAVADFLGLDDLLDDEPVPTALAGAAERSAVLADLVSRIRAGAFDEALLARDRDGLDPICFAAAHGLLELVDALLARGVPANGSRDRGRPLVHAAAHGHLACVDALLAAGAEPDASEAVYPPLMRAAERGHLEVVAALLEAGADPRLRTDAGESAMDRAGGLEVEAIRALLSRYAEGVPSRGRALERRGAVAPSEPGLGIGPFLDLMLGGHPEWVFLAVRAPVEEVSSALAEAWGAVARHSDVAHETVPEGEGAFVLQLLGHEWSYVPVEIGDYRPEAATRADAAAPVLATGLDTLAVVSYGEDTSGSVGVRAFFPSGATEALEWDGGEELRYEGEGEPPAGRTGEERLRGYFERLLLFVPPAHVEGDGFGRWLVLHHVDPAAVERLDWVQLG